MSENNIPIRFIKDTEKQVLALLQHRESYEEALFATYVNDYQQLASSYKIKQEEIRHLSKELANGVQLPSTADSDKITEAHNELQNLYKKLASKDEYCIELKAKVENYK